MSMEDPWIDCEIGKRYRVKTKTASGAKVEPTLGGKTGRCVATEDSPFGHKWADLKMDDEPLPVRVRTNHLEEV